MQESQVSVQTPQEQPAVGAEGSTESIIRAPRHWARLLKRCQGLSPGRYTITLTVAQGYADWTVTDIGKVER